MGVFDVDKGEWARWKKRVRGVERKSGEGEKVEWVRWKVRVGDVEKKSG